MCQNNIKIDQKDQKKISIVYENIGESITGKSGTLMTYK